MRTIDLDKFLSIIHENIERLIQREVTVISLTDEIEKSIALKKCIENVILNDATRLCFNYKIDIDFIKSNEDLSNVILQSTEYRNWVNYAKSVFSKANEEEIIISIPLDIKLPEYPMLKMEVVETEWKYSLYDMLKYLRSRFEQAPNVE